MKVDKLVVALLLILTACTLTKPEAASNPSELEIQPEFQQVVSVPLENSANDSPAPTPTHTPVPESGADVAEVPSSTPATRSQEKPTPTETPLSSEPVQDLGPDQFPQGINPLTGLPVENPDLLNLPPALISVTNFPVSARPQAGLSFSPYVYELYIGEGMTRFLAMFYGEYPSLDPQTITDTTVLANNQAEIGPVRSGRLPYQAIRKLYNGFLVMASASAEVKEATTDYTNLFGSDSDDINSALIDVTSLQGIAASHQTSLNANLSGNIFAATPPESAQDGDSLWVFYSFLNQVLWKFDPAAGAYLRFQDQADGSGEFYPASDRLTGEQLAFENVILLFVRHQVLNSAGTLIDVDLLYNEGYAYLFRDGEVVPIYWTTLGEDYEKTTGQLRPIRFTDRSGNPIPLKPGSTWVELVDVTTTFSETQPGSWKARFYAP